MKVQDTKTKWIIQDNIDIAYNKINRERFRVGVKFIEERAVYRKAKDIAKAKGIELLNASKIIKEELWTDLVLSDK